MPGFEYTMTLSRNGQVSIPAPTRARWNTDKIVVVDLGDYVVMRPATDDPVATLRGSYAGRGPTSEAMRRRDRREEAATEARRRR